MHRGKLMKLVFIVGAPRSGTTWLQLLLSQSEHISTAQETHLFNEYLVSLEQSWRSHQNDVRSRGLQALYSREQFTALKRGISDDVFRRILGNKKSASIVLEKTPDHVYSWEEILDLYPNAYFIHLVRDPRAVVASMRATGREWKNPWARAGVGGLSKLWSSSVEAAEQISHATRNFRELKYETLSSNILYETWSWLCLEETPDAAEAAFRACALQNLKTATEGPQFQPWDVQSEPPAMLRKGENDSWTSELSSSEIAIVESICRPLMKKYSYQIIGQNTPLKYRAYCVAEAIARRSENFARQLFRAARKGM